MICSELINKGISVFKVKFPLERDLIKNRYGVKTCFTYGNKIFSSAKYYKEIFEKDINKWTRYSYDEIIEDFKNAKKPKLRMHGKRRIYVVGPCIVSGFYNPSGEQLTDILQSFLDDYERESFEIVPIIYFHKEIENIFKLYEEEICENDIVLFVNHAFENLRQEDLDLTLSFNSYAGDKCLYLEDVPIHTTVYGNELVVKEIMDNILIPVISLKKQKANGRGKVLHYPEMYLSMEDEKNLMEYISSISSILDVGKKNIGCIVMNANPFTKGHLHLVETASKQVDFLYIFVLEEDVSQFSYKARMDMVKQGCSKFRNVIVVPSGNFIISSRTFKNYFEKDELQEKIVDTAKDVTLFGKYIAPALKITKRFVGEEPFDKVTLQYNEAMKKRLPQYGVELIEIPRLQAKDVVVSATVVRKLVEDNEWKQLREYVPVTTYSYIRQFGYGEKVQCKRDNNIRIKNWNEVLKWVSEKENFVIYGTGGDAIYIWNNIQEYNDRILSFCDKKANDREYEFKGLKVIKPSELKSMYDNIPILVSSRRYGKEIFGELLRSGINEDLIMCCI